MGLKITTASPKIQLLVNNLSPRIPNAEIMLPLGSINALIADPEILAF